MEEDLAHLEGIKENILKQMNEIKEQSKYFEYNIFNIVDNNKNNNKKYMYNFQKMLVLFRPSMVNISKNIKSIEMSPKHYLLEESSDNEDGYNEDTKQSFPSLIKVANNIVDPNVIMILTDIKYFPKEAEPGLIITGIEDWVTEKHLKIFLKGVPSFIDKYKLDKNNNYYKKNETPDLDINSIKFFTELNKRYAYVKLNSYNQMEIIGNFFLHPIKQLYPSYNSKKEKIEVYFAYDLLKLTKNHWYGVILRNLPPNCSDKSIYDFTDQKVKNGIKYCLNPIIIDNIYCSLVVCKELEYAEKLCHCLNNKDIGNNKYIKAHLHPNICKIRNENFYNNYETFSKEGYLFNINAEQSEKYLPFAKPFMEFFFPDYFESFNNNIKSKKKEKEIKNLNDDSKKNKEKEKNIKREKDLTLASSILDLIKKTSSQNLKDKSLINNNNEQNISKNKADEIQNDDNHPIKNNNKSTIIPEQHSQTNLDINKINSQTLSLNTDSNLNESKINNENKEKDNAKNKSDNQNNEIKDNNSVKYSQEEINYYTYNMGDQKYYEDLENQNQRKTSSYQQRNNYYKDENKNYYKSNNYNREYKSQRYEYNKNIPSPHRQYNNTSYKKQNFGYQKYNKERENNTQRNYDNNYKERSREKERERSRDKNDIDEWKDFRYNMEKRNDNYYNGDKRKEREWERDNQRDKEKDKEWNRDKEREKDRDRNWDKDRQRDRERVKEWEKGRERYRERDKDRERDKYRERDRERYSDDRNRRYNDYRYYERNNNNKERRKESWHSKSRQNDDRERREKYTNNNLNKK